MSTQTMKTSNRRALHAYVSDEAHDAWHDFAAENGVTVSGFLEALTPHLLAAADAADGDAVSLEAAWADSIKGARAVDAQRRRRS